MGEWFQERYISRDEHQTIVAYYRKLVARLYGSVRDLRAEADARADDVVPGTEQGPENPAAETCPAPCQTYVPPEAYGRNVIHLDFRRRGARHAGPGHC